MAYLRSRGARAPDPSDYLAILKSLPDKVDQLLRPTPSGRGAGWQSVSSLNAQLEAVYEYVGREGIRDQHEALASQVLSLRNGAVGVAVLRLLSAALRVELYRPPGAQEAARSPPAAGSSSSAVRTWLGLGLLASAMARFLLSSPESAEFFRKLLATQALQASAAHLAAATDLLDRQPQLLRGEEGDPPILALNTAAMLMRCVLTGVQSASRPVGGAETAAAAALRDSRILEHAARLLLRMRTSRAMRREADAALGFYTDFRSSLDPIEHILPSAPPPEDMQLAEAASGPCADFLAMAFGLATLCAADGGSWYGMPEEVRQRLPVLTVEDSDPKRFSRPSRSSVASRAALSAPMALVSAINQRVRDGRVRRRTGVEVLMRVCRMGVDSVRAPPAGAGRGEGSTASGSGGAGPSGSPTAAAAAAAADAADPPRRLLLLPRHGAMVAVCGLVAVRELLADRPVAWADVQKEWWRLAVALYRPPPEGAEGWHPRFGLPVLWYMPQDVTIPPTPLPDLAPVLDAGLLPALERVIRRAAEDPKGPEAQQVAGLTLYLSEHYTAHDSFRRFLTPLLAHGDPRQAAALVASFAKALRRKRDAMQQGDTPLARLAVLLLHEALDILHAMADPASEQQQQQPQQQPHPGPHAPQQQFLTLMASMLREWVSPLCGWTLARWSSYSRDVDVQRACNVLRFATQIMAVAVCIRMQELHDAAAAAAGAHGVTDAQQSDRVDRDGDGDGGSADGDSGGSGWDGGDGTEDAERDGGGGSSSAGGSEPAAGDLPEADGGWDVFLWWDSGLVSLARAQLVRFELVRLSDGEPDPIEAAAIAEVCLVLSVACQYDLRVTTREATEAAAAAAVGRTRAAICPVAGLLPGDLPLPAPLLRRLIPDVALCEDGEFRALAAGLEALARLVELWSVHDIGEEVPEEGPLLDEIWSTVWGLVGHVGPAARLLGPPVGASSLLGRPACANPDCTDLSGDGELQARLQQCSRCRTVWYCCRGCQTAHWQAGHKEECRSLRASGGSGEEEPRVQKQQQG